MADETIKCPIWNTEACRTRIPNGSIHVDVSDRAGGGYIIDDVAQKLISGLEGAEKARLTTWLIDKRSEGVVQPTVTEDVIAYIQSRQPLAVHQRAERLLRYIARESSQIGSRVVVQDITLQAYAWSESTKGEEVKFLLDYLVESRWISEDFRTVNGVSTSYVTVEGYRRIEDLETRIDSSQAFVAMWFDPRLDDAYDLGFAPGIEAAGYKPDRVDKDLSVGKIDDAIIAKIRQSGFVVADFTHGEAGARGNVYFEAGFAKGLGKPVIYTCHDDEANLAFDTRQYAHIFWETPQQLKVDLENRIRARIGQGPEGQPLTGRP